MQHFRQPFVRQRRLRTDRERGQQAMHAIQQQAAVGFRRLLAQELVELIQFTFAQAVLPFVRCVHPFPISIVTGV